MDLFIVGFVLSAVTFGFHRGLWLTAFEYVGLVVGIAGGALLAPVALDQIERHLGVNAIIVRIVVVVLMVGAGALVGSTIAHELGAPVRRAARHLRAVAVLDGVGGAVLTAVVTLGTIWYVGLMLSRGPSTALAAEIQGSRIMRGIDHRVPRPPTALVRLEEHLSSQVFPQMFVGLEPRLPTRVAPDGSAIDTDGVRSAAAVTVKIEAPGCGGIQLGSGFPVARDRILTNAHVLSGTRSVKIALPGSPHAVTGHVVLMDPARDIAIILVPELGMPPLAPAAGVRGEQVAIIGYPGGGALDVHAGVLNTEMRARSRDIYEDATVTRGVWVVVGRARPGNSGGPLVNARGEYVGIVFAESLGAADEAYAITAAEAADLVSRSRDLTEAIDTSTYPCTS